MHAPICVFVCKSAFTSTKRSGAARAVWAQILGWLIRNMACANPDRIRANPFSLRISANCESEPQARPRSSRRPAGAKKSSAGNNVKKPCESWSDSHESVQFANPCQLGISNRDANPDALCCCVRGRFRILVSALVCALPGIFQAAGVLLLVLMMYAITGVYLFQVTLPPQP